MSQPHRLSDREKSYIHGQIMMAGAIHAYFETSQSSAAFVERMIEAGRMIERADSVERHLPVHHGGEYNPHIYEFTPAGVEWAYSCGLLDEDEITEAKQSDLTWGQPVTTESAEGGNQPQSLSTDGFKRIDAFFFGGREFETIKEASRYALEKVQEILPGAEIEITSKPLEIGGRQFRILGGIKVRHDITYGPTEDDPQERRSVTTERHSSILLNAPDYITVSQASALATLMIGRSIGRQYVKDEVIRWTKNKSLGLSAPGLPAALIGKQYNIAPDAFYWWMMNPRRGSRSAMGEE